MNCLIFQFDIFSGVKGSSDDSKTLVVGIPYASKGCGRVSTHISFTDKTVINSVGKEVEYSVRSLQRGSAYSLPTYSPGSTDKVYRIPFLSTIIGTVRTKSGVGVPNVSIRVCHISPITALNDNYGTPYCPLFDNLITDARGHFESEIRISDPAWTRVEEHFNISVAYTEYLSLDVNTTIHHEFEPPHQIVAMRQVYPSKITFIDKTAVSIFGSVKFDPSHTDGKDCVFPGVPVHLVHGNGNMDNTTAASDGSFNFTVSIGEKAYLYIPDYRGYTWDSFVRSAVVNTTAVAANASPTPAPVVIPDYVVTSEWPQDTGIGKGLYDFNWIQISPEINFPGRIISPFVIGPHKLPTNAAGWIYFQTSFTVPNYADYNCLSIPFKATASGRTATNVVLNNRTVQGWVLDNLHSNNKLIVAVEYSYASVVNVSVKFSVPIKQCPKIKPMSTGISGGSIDYSWMVSSSASFPVTGSLDFASQLDGSYSKFICNQKDLTSPGNHFAYQTMFTLSGFRNYSCIDLPIFLSVLNYNFEEISINEVDITFPITATISSFRAQLAPHLNSSNVLRLTLSKIDRSTQSGLSVVFGDVRVYKCEEFWPQSTGISTFKSSDNNWRLKYNSTYRTQALTVSYVLSTWIPVTNRAKWIGSVENAYRNKDKSGNYTFETEFKLANEVNFPCLQIEFNLSSSCPLILIMLNGKAIYNCSAPNYCGVTSYKQTTLLLSTYLQPQNILQIIVSNTGSSPTGIMTSFATKALSTQCFTDAPMSTGQGIAGDLDNNWIAIDDAGLKTTPVLVPSFSTGANWISSSNIGPTTYQTSFKLPAFINFRSIKLPIMVGICSDCFVLNITVNGHPSFDEHQYSLSSLSSSSTLFLLSLEYLEASNIVEFRLRNKSARAQSVPLLVTFGDPITDDLTPWPKSTGTSHFTSHDFNWMITELIISNTETIPMQYPSSVKTSDSRYVLTPTVLQNSVGIFNFHSTFDILHYDNANCLQIPFEVSGADSISYIRFNGQLIFVCQITACNDLNLKLSGFEASNTLDIGVNSMGVSGASLSVIFSTPGIQCALETPHSTRGSVISAPIAPLSVATAQPISSSSCLPFSTSTTLDRDYAWMIIGAPDSRQVPYFSYLLHAVPVDWYIPLNNNGWITTVNSACDTNGFYTFAMAFALSFYANFSCVKLPISIAATGSISQIRLNGYFISFNLSSISTNALYQFQLKSFHLKVETNLLEIIFHTDNQAPALFVEIGQLRFDSCVSLWPQSTGRSEYTIGTLDENWLISATLGSGQALPLQEAIIIDSIPNNWFADKSYGRYELFNLSIDFLTVYYIYS